MHALNHVLFGHSPKILFHFQAPYWFSPSKCKLSFDRQRLRIDNDSKVVYAVLGSAQPRACCTFNPAALELERDRCDVGDVGALVHVLVVTPGSSWPSL
jgi:hypothetical protein